MEFQIWLVLNAVIVGVVLGAIFGYGFGKRKATTANPELSSKVAALEATELELRTQLAKADLSLEQQRLQQDQEN